MNYYNHIVYILMFQGNCHAYIAYYVLFLMIYIIYLTVTIISKILKRLENGKCMEHACLLKNNIEIVFNIYTFGK